MTGPRLACCRSSPAGDAATLEASVHVRDEVLVRDDVVRPDEGLPEVNDCERPARAWRALLVVLQRTVGSRVALPGVVVVVAVLALVGAVDGHDRAVFAFADAHGQDGRWGEVWTQGAVAGFDGVGVGGWWRGAIGRDRSDEIGRLGRVALARLWREDHADAPGW